MSATVAPARSRGRVDLDMWLRRGCALIVAAVAAYSSFEHQREFALRGGADSTNAVLWPLSVDGLLLLATVGLLKPGQRTRRMRIVVWVAFLGCIAVSLAANVAAAPRLAWQPVLVAGWPPVALLLAVELLAHRSRRPSETDQAATQPEPAEAPIVRPTEPADPVANPAAEPTNETARESAGQPGRVLSLGELSATSAGPADEPRAQDVMWAHVLKEQERGRIPTGAELDRVAGTNNYGRTVLRQWREQGRLPAATNGVQRMRGGAA